MAERTAEIGGTINFANASPGAGIFLDPDKRGHLFHRNIAWQPGGEPLPPPDISHDAAGDAAMTQLFLDTAVLGRPPAVAVLWQCEPDNTQHGVPLGSPAHLDVIRAADAQAGRVYDNVRTAVGNGELLFICASDHGHETVSSIVDIEEYLVDQGVKAGSGSSDVVVAPQGLSVTIYLSDDARGRLNRVVEALNSHPEVGQVYAGDSLEKVDLNPDGAIAIVATGRTDDELSDAGVPGRSVAFQGDLKISNNIGCGQHGGVGPNEQSPFMICAGSGFDAGLDIAISSSAIDIAPTAMRHLGVSATGMDGRALQS